MCVEVFALFLRLSLSVIAKMVKGARRLRIHRLIRLLDPIVCSLIGLTQFFGVTNFWVFRLKNYEIYNYK